MSRTTIRVCQNCGKAFETEDDFMNRRKYCSDECARRGHIQTINEVRRRKREESYPCEETRCKFYKARFSNNCIALERAYIENCPFFKPILSKKKEK